ncbi:oxalate/formate exchange protein (macronuclear) [Tetrahymena thermophila SB210]|uniref:Oxalate/formate exchange protein n=1 Tax=Tetrahymena thermophila (strain SB210) TaxID=312017 RepID=Q23YQ4_TETTS|nr:oxalate/formate exchange protein [Tetrahymena thermophila SB210]EAS01668.2 oxalate/formate exchange protein [Tetrahymena thermophila SB210]|eukprot:XP_001021913.2 oxalate/formate exchange protein [Tetrahymena thermophila SB210]
MQKKIEYILGSISCALIILLCSDFKVWSIINTYAYSYLRQFNPSLQMNDVNGIFFWISFATSTGIQSGLYFAYKFGFRRMLMLNGLICSLFVFCSSFCTNFYAFTFTFGVGNVFFGGLIYLIAFDRAYKIFPNHKEISCGLLNVMFGVGILGQGQLYFLLINKNDIHLVEDQDYYPSEVADNVPWALRYASIVYASLVIISVLCYRPSLFQEKASMVGFDSTNDPQQSAISGDVSNQGYQSFNDEELWNNDHWQLQTIWVVIYKQ